MNDFQVNYDNLKFFGQHSVCIQISILTIHSLMEIDVSVIRYQIQLFQNQCCYNYVV